MHTHLNWVFAARGDKTLCLTAIMRDVKQHRRARAPMDERRQDIRYPAVFLQSSQQGERHASGRLLISDEKVYVSI